MNNEKMVTRCPQCGTSFRITPAQLQSARGAVRCGACLHIFKARDHLVGSPRAASPDSALVRKPTHRPTTPAPPASGQKAANKRATSSTKAPNLGPGGTDRKGAGQAYIERQKSPSQQTEQEPRRTGQSSAARPTGQPQKTPPTRQPQTPPKAASKAEVRFNQRAPDSESNGLDDDDFLISDDMGQSKSEEKDPFGIARQARGNAHSLFERSARREDEESETRDDTDESWAMSLLEDEEEDSSSAATVSRADEAQKALDDEDIEERSPSFELVGAPTDAQLAEASGDDHMRIQLEDSPESEPSYEGDRMRAYNAERSALLMNIDPEPVEMNWTRQRQRHIHRKWLWSGLAVLALTFLAVQIAWLQFDRLSRIEPYRSVYEFVCPWAGCDVPALVDRSRIRAYNLVVRNHPDREGALVVDAILLNTARFSQPFPELVLEFSDINGTALAARAFLPEEYLSGELAGRETMPPNQPIHLTLELVDPGEQAVNYRAYIPE